MTALALNHITVPDLSAPEVISLAASLGCAGVELRLDGLPGVDGTAVSPQSLQSAEAAREAASKLGIRVIALSELRAFNDWNTERAELAAQLMTLATACGAEGILLLPRNDGYGHGNGERQASLRLALRELGPMLTDAKLLGFIEPLGFERSSLRSKQEVVDAIESLDESKRFRLVHDTFHHHLGGDASGLAKHTGLVHISSVINPVLSISEIRDSDRVLPHANDRLGSLEQIAELQQTGYAGPISITSFSPSLPVTDHGRTQALEALSASVEWLASSLNVQTAGVNHSDSKSRLVTSVT